MGYDGFGPAGWFGHFFGIAVMGIFCLVAIVITIGLIFLLVRFLLVATTAAQLYVARNSPSEPQSATAVAATTKPTTTTTTTAPKTPKP